MACKVEMVLIILSGLYGVSLPSPGLDYSYRILFSSPTRIYSVKNEFNVIKANNSLYKSIEDRNSFTCEHSFKEAVPTLTPRDLGQLQCLSHAQRVEQVT